MSDGTAAATSGERADDRLRMDLYELLVERAETERRWQFWRLAAGHAVVGLVVGYALVFDRVRFVALAPILYGVVVMDALKTSVRRLYIQQRLVELEAELAEREPLADWVTRYGFFGRGSRVEVAEVDLDAIPETAQYALVAAIYLGLVAVSLLAWSPLPGGTLAFGVGTSRTLLVVGYATFTLLFAVIVGVAYLHYDRVRERVREVAGDGAGGEGAGDDAGGSGGRVAGDGRSTGGDSTAE